MSENGFSSREQFIPTPNSLITVLCLLSIPSYGKVLASLGLSFPICK